MNKNKKHNLYYNNKLQKNNLFNNKSKIKKKS